MRLPRRLRAMLPALVLAAGALFPALVAAPASAGRSISTPLGQAPGDTIPYLDGGLPSPDYAARLSANATLYPLAVSGILLTLGFANGSDAGMVSVLGAGVIGSAGIALGPRAGYSYGRVEYRGNLGALARTALVAGMPFVTARARRNAYYDDDLYDFVAIAFSGVGLAALSAVWDVHQVARHVERRNARVSASDSSRTSTHMQFVPCTTPGTRRPGLAVRVSF